MCASTRCVAAARPPARAPLSLFLTASLRFAQPLLEQFCRDHNFAGWFATSAASNQGIDEAMNFLTTKILEVARANRLPEQNADSVEVGTAGSTGADSNKKKTDTCCN
jgi:hypothetical protein